jgi:DNA polymerase-3 subunit delta'
LNLNSWLEKIGTENKQGSIFAEESGEIIRKINMKSYESEYKIMIIWMPEKMNVSAGNKLLKMIEEPPDKTIFLLVAEDSKMMLQTILSRCQLIKITAVESKDIEKALTILHVPDDRIKDITRLANGNYLKALDLIQTNEEDKYNFDQFVQFMRLCYQQKIVEIVSWVDAIAGIGREKQKIFLIYALRMIRENFMLNQKMTSIVFLTREEDDFSQKFSPFINDRNIFAIAEEISKAHYHIESNANPKILFLDLALKVVKLIKN